MTDRNGNEELRGAMVGGLESFLLPRRSVSTDYYVGPSAVGFSHSLHPLRTFKQRRPRNAHLLAAASYRERTPRMHADSG